MLVRQGYKFRLKAGLHRKRGLSRISGSVRFVWNRALALQKDRLGAGEALLGYPDLCRCLTQWKKAPDTDFLNEAPSQALQQTLKDLVRAFREWSSSPSGKGFPRFKKKGHYDAFRYPQGFKVEGPRIYLPRVGWVRFFKSRDIEGRVQNVTVSREGEQWTVSIQTERDVPEPHHQSSSAVGIDLGVRQFATLSDGTVYHAPNMLEKEAASLARAQRRLSRKVKFSKNWQKAKRRITRLHERIARSRGDFLHKVSTEVSKNHAAVVLEDLTVKGMSRSAKGSKEAPGRNVRAKAGLNRAILDQGWYAFRRMVEYKEGWRGGRVILVDPRHTSLRCPECGTVSRNNRPRREWFRCVNCGTQGDADLIAARNILAVGHTVTACGGKVESRLPAKQEPRKVTSVA